MTHFSLILAAAFLTENGVPQPPAQRAPAVVQDGKKGSILELSDGTKITTAAGIKMNLKRVKTDRGQRIMVEVGQGVVIETDFLRLISADRTTEIRIGDDGLLNVRQFLKK